jgi:hypothetical protein
MRAHRRDDSSSADASGRDAARVPRVRASAVGWAGTHQLARALAFALVLSEPVLRELLVALQAAQPLDRLGNVLADVARRLHGRAREEHGHLDRRLRCLARGRVAGENDKGGRNAPRNRKKSTFLTSRNRESQTVVLARYEAPPHWRNRERRRIVESSAVVRRRDDLARDLVSRDRQRVSICCLTSVDCCARQTDGRAGRDTRGERSRVGFRRDAPAFISRPAASNTPSRA